VLGLNKALDARTVANIRSASVAGSTTLNLANLRGAITTLQAADLEPTAIVVNPTDWQAIESSAATQCASNDNFPAATEAMQRKLYGLSVVVTNSTAAGKALVGDFRGSARIYRTHRQRVDHAARQSAAGRERDDVRRLSLESDRDQVRDACRGGRASSVGLRASRPGVVNSGDALGLLPDVPRRPGRVVLTFAAALPGAHERAPVTPGVDRLRAGAFVSEGENQRIGSVRSSRP